MYTKRCLAAGGLVAVTALLAAACGSGSSSSARSTSTASKTAKATTANASAHRPEADSAAAIGTVSSVNGSEFVLNGAKGSNTVLTSPATHFSQVVTAGMSALAVGQCVRATGPVNSIGTVEAKSVTIMAAINAAGTTTAPHGNPAAPASANASANAAGSCALGFGVFRRAQGRPTFTGAEGSGGIGRPSSGASPYGGPPSGSYASPAGFQGAFGKIAAIEPSSAGETLEVQGPSGQTGVAVGSATKVLETESASMASVTPGTCASAFGKKTSAGEIEAAEVTVTPGGPTGCSTAFGPRVPFTRAGET
jgi:hypothetical protein